MLVVLLVEGGGGRSIETLPHLTRGGEYVGSGAMAGIQTRRGRSWLGCRVKVGEETDWLVVKRSFVTRNLQSSDLFKNGLFLRVHVGIVES